MVDTFSFKQAQEIITSEVKPTDIDRVNILGSLGRITAASHRASQPYPHYSQSQYDGFAIAKHRQHSDGHILVYRLLGEIAAGQTKELKCQPGGAFRIMTGAPFPQNAWKVIPQEHCRISAEKVYIPQEVVASSPQNIKKKGADIGKGAVLAHKGTCLSPANLARLTDGGVEKVEVYQSPEVAFFCSGSELVDKSSSQKFGKKVSSNRTMLSGLIQSFGGRANYFGTVVDEPKKIAEILAAIREKKPHVIISTGGMGPGKYDLLKESFEASGGKVFFRSLKLRPGKSTLFGLLGGSLYFGLPGPPPAAYALFHALIRPALLKLQGYTNWKRQSIIAHLDTDLFFPNTGVVRLVEGVVIHKKGKVRVRAISRKEYGDCFIHCPANRKQLKKDMSVLLIPTAPPPYLPRG